MSYLLALKAEALHRADRASEALQAITEAEAFVESTGGRYISAELHRLRGILLAAVGADEAKLRLPSGKPSAPPSNRSRFH